MAITDVPATKFNRFLTILGLFLIGLGFTYFSERLDEYQRDRIAVTGEVNAIKIRLEDYQQRADTTFLTSDYQLDTRFHGMTCMQTLRAVTTDTQLSDQAIDICLAVETLRARQEKVSYLQVLYNDADRITDVCLALGLLLFLCGSIWWGVEDFRSKSASESE